MESNKNEHNSVSEFERWLQKAEDTEIRSELLSVADNPAEISERFYSGLSFGTGGLRGVLGAGTARMNVYTVKKATSGVAGYLLAMGGKSIVIAYDSRNKSAEFARLAAEIASSKGIKAYLFSEITPTPVLSFAVRYLKTSAGIVITASHNPKEYNGYKVYNSQGCQITDAMAKAITEKINTADYFDEFIPNAELIEVLDEKVKNAFFAEIKRFSLTNIKSENAPSIVYSPLNGTGINYVPRALLEAGVKELHIVAEQAIPDGDFTTCPYPNPEEKAAMTLALRDAEKYKPDLVMATDPDADRIGIAVPNERGEYTLLNGNETGALIMEYMLLRKAENGDLGKDPTIIKTIVTTDMAFEIARAYNAEIKEVLTGFKYIGEELDKTENFVMGMEESYGYLVGDHARDKDAVSAAIMIAEACAYHRSHDTTLWERLKTLYDTFGYYKTDLRSVKYDGADGMAKMLAITNEIRRNVVTEFEGKALEFTDFSSGINGLPRSNVLRFRNEEVRLIIRPSGTEPKLKIYYQAKGDSEKDADEKLKRLKGFDIINSQTGRC